VLGDTKQNRRRRSSLRSARYLEIRQTGKRRQRDPVDVRIRDTQLFEEGYCELSRHHLLSVPENAYATVELKTKAKSRIPTPVAVALITVVGAIIGALIKAGTSSCPQQLQAEKEQTTTLQKRNSSLQGERDLSVENLGEVTRLCGGARGAGGAP
jgi:hypothetical protein